MLAGIPEAFEAQQKKGMDPQRSINVRGHPVLLGDSQVTERITNLSNM